MSQKSREKKAVRKRSMDRSRASQSQSSQSTPAMTEEEFKALAADVVKFILCMHYENKVIKRADIISHVAKGKNVRGNKFKELMDKVGKRFDKILGIKLVHIDQEHTLFTLVNKQEELEGSLSLHGSTVETAKQGFLSLILAYLYMKKNPVKEDQLHRFLTNLGILDNEFSFETYAFGDIKKLLQEFVKQQYLDYYDLPSHDPDDKIKVYEWGKRAHATISKNDVLKFMGKIYDCPPSRWEEMLNDVEDKCGHSDDD